MSVSDRQAFLADVHIGVVSIASGAAPPLAVPVWYGYEAGGDVMFVFEAASQKVRLIEACGEATLCAQSEAVPYKYVSVSGPAVIEDFDADLKRSITYRYLGPEIGDIYLAATSEAAEVVVRLQTTTWRTTDYTKMVEALLPAS